MLKIFSRKAWFWVFFGFGTVFSIAVTGTSVAVANSDAINSALGISTSSADRSGAKKFEPTYKTAEEVKEYFSSVAVEAENEGLVLLKNEGNALPLPSDSQKKVTLIGTACYRFNYNTSGSSATDSSDYMTFEEALTGAGFTINPTVADYYKNGGGKNYGRLSGVKYEINEAPISGLSEEAISSMEQYGDVVILTLARESGEGSDLTTKGSDGDDGSYLSLSEAEKGILAKLTELRNAGKISRVVVLLNSSNPIEVDFAFSPEYKVDALAWVGNVGAYGIQTIPNVLLGKVNPSGRLSDTYCRDNFSSPAMASWAKNYGKLFSQPYGGYEALLETSYYYGVYNEGIYLGYRYYETRYSDVVAGRTGAGEWNYDDVVGYPFGYGLSYSSFSYSDYNVDFSDDKNVVITLKVTNDSDVPGKHTVLAFLQKPYTAYDVEHGIEKSSVELVGFEKTGLLAAHASENVTITVEKELMKSYDADGAKTYILDAGDYLFTVATDAHEAAKNFLAKQGHVVGGNEAMVKSTNVASLDTTKYSKSTETGAAITNHFDHADVNRYEGRGENSVVYVSRSNWVGTFPSSSNILNANTEKLIADLTPNKALPTTDQAMPQYGVETDLVAADLRGLPYDAPEWDTLLNSMTYAEQAKFVTSGLNGTITMAGIGIAESFAKDGPTAIVKSPTGSMPSEGIWASTFNREILEKIGDAIAEDAHLNDIQSMWAPGINLHRAPFVGRTNEYFSEDPFLTGVSAECEVIGMQKKGIIAHLKHFAFNDEETDRNGISIWLNEQEARELLLYPFERAVYKGQAHAIMSSFNRIGPIWAGADKDAQISVLRDEWGFEGFLLTDMAEGNGKQYMTYQDGIIGGTNIFLGNGGEKFLDDWKDNAAYANAVRDSAHRIAYNILNYSAAMDGIAGKVQYVAPWWQNLLTGVSIGTGVIAFIALGLSLASLFLTLKKKS